MRPEQAGSEQIERWRRLLARPEVVRELAQLELPPRPAMVAALRARLGEPLLGPALALAQARRQAAAKFPSRPDLLACPEGIEQASSERCAAHKARRFAALQPLPARVLDLCCGIGGDAMALAAVLPTYAFDRLPLRAWMAARNAGCPAAAADVTTLRLRGEVFHLDPARRAEGRRLHRYAQLRPGPAFIERLLAANPTGAIKLGPGVELAELPLAGERELEVIGEGRGLVQAVLWAGRLARQPGARTATRLPAGRSFSARPAPVPLAPLGRYLHAVDPAIERAGLLGALAAELGLGALHPRVALLSAERIHASPWLVPFEVLEAMPWGERRVGLALRALGAGRGRLEVKTRGFAEHASALARRLGRRLGEGGALLTLFVVRLERSPLAIIARRCRRPEAGLPAAGPC